MIVFVDTNAKAEIRDLVLWDPVTLTPTLMEVAWGMEDRDGFS